MRQIFITPQGTPNYKVIFGAIIGLILLSAGFSFLLFSKRDKEADVTNSDEPSSPPIPASGMLQSKEILLYFVHPDTTELVVDKRSIYPKVDFIKSLKQIIQELIKGSTAGLINPIPNGAQLREVFFSPGSGCVYIDFSGDFSKAHTGGVTAELLTIQSIIKTLKANFPAKIQLVQILIDGKEAETIAGHIDISRPLYLEE